VHRPFSRASVAEHCDALIIARSASLCKWKFALTLTSFREFAHLCTSMPLPILCLPRRQYHLGMYVNGSLCKTETLIFIFLMDFTCTHKCFCHSGRKCAFCRSR